MVRLSRLLLFAFAASLQGIAPALAEDWPNRPVTMVVPFAAGGGTDVLGRIIGRRLSETLGQQVVIENVGGAGGMIGSYRVMKAPPDGYQFVLGSRADAINQTLYKTPLYSLKDDLAPVVLIAEQPMVLAARNTMPVNGLQEFIAYVKANQSTMKFGSAGTGSTGHVDCALLNAAMGVNIPHIPYRGGGPALQDLIAGRFDYFCTLSATAVPPIDSKLVKGIGVFTPYRAAIAARPSHRCRSGHEGFRGLDLVRVLRAQAHTGADHQETSRRHHRGDGHAGGAEATARHRHLRGRTRAPFDRILAALRGDRNREERRADQGSRDIDRIDQRFIRTPICGLLNLELSPAKLDPRV